MARENKLAWAALGDVTLAVQTFLDPVLGQGIDAVWEPTQWLWRTV
jgi:hypothetical protein